MDAGKLWRTFAHMDETAMYEEIIDFGDLPVFENATTYPCIIRIGKTVSLSKQDKNEFRAINVQTLKFDSLQTYVN